MSFDLFGIGPVALGVVATLLLMSVASVGIMAERWWTLRRVARRSREDLERFRPLLQAGRREEALKLSARGRPLERPLAYVLVTGLVEWERVAAWRTQGAVDLALDCTRQAVRYAAEGNTAELRRRLPTLATIGSTAPFVGLLGTTFGIINAFRSVALTGAGNISVISAGISEALVTTALGLFVAIPAVWAYNALQHRADALSLLFERSGHELVRHLSSPETGV